MNVFKIERLWIAAKTTQQAFAKYVEHTGFPDNLQIYELKEGEKDEINVALDRLTQDEINEKRFDCCNEEDKFNDKVCKFCKDHDTTILTSLADRIAQTESFPAVILEEL